MGWHPASSRSGGRLRPGTRGGASGGTPVPGESAEGHLQGAGPVDSPQEWVGIQPALDLAEGFVQVLAAASQEERLCQEREVLVTVQFPDHFVIADSREVQIGRAPKVRRAARHPMQVVAPPVDHGSGIARYSEDRETG